MAFRRRRSDRCVLSCAFLLMCACAFCSVVLVGLGVVSTRWVIIRLLWFLPCVCRSYYMCVSVRDIHKFWGVRVCVYCNDTYVISNVPVDSSEMAKATSGMQRARQKKTKLIHEKHGLDP